MSVHSMKHLLLHMLNNILYLLHSSVLYLFHNENVDNWFTYSAMKC